MNKFLKNFNDLYSEDDTVVYQAIIDKKDWILTDLYLPGDLAIKTSDDGLKHFSMLEDVVFNRLALDVYPFMENMHGMNAGFNSLRYKVFFNRIKPGRNNLFWIHYDFRQLSKENYQKLVANFYPRLSEDELEIGATDFASFRDAMKLLMVGDEDEKIIILHVDDLKEAHMETPKASEIIVHSSAAEEIKVTLKEIAKSKKIGYREDNYE